MEWDRSQKPKHDAENRTGLKQHFNSEQTQPALKTQHTVFRRNVLLFQSSLNSLVSAGWWARTDRKLPVNFWSGIRTKRIELETERKVTFKWRFSLIESATFCFPPDWLWAREKKLNYDLMSFHTFRDQNKSVYRMNSFDLKTSPRSLSIQHFPIQCIALSVRYEPQCEKPKTHNWNFKNE